LHPSLRSSARSLTRWSLTLVVVMATAAPAAAQSAATPLYDVEDLSPHGGFRFNQAGDIAGVRFSPPVSPNAYPAFRPSVFRSSGWVDLTVPSGDTDAVFLGINDLGEAVGYAYNPNASGFPYGRWRAVRGTTTLTVMSSLLPPNSFNYAINDNGVIVGCRYDDLLFSSDYRVHIYTGSGGPIFPFSAQNDRFSCAYDVNAAGQVVGQGFDATGAPRGFRYWVGAPTPLTLLETPDAYLSDAWGINANGDITGAGFHKAGPSSSAQAFVYTAGGAIVDLGVGATGAITSNGRKINTTGDVVGDMTRNFGNTTTPDYRLRALLATNGQVFDLNDLVPPGSGWSLQSSLDIDEQGRILVSGSPASNGYGYALLTPRSPQQVADGLIQAIQKLRTDGVLSAGNASALITKVQGALQSIAVGDNRSAANQLGAFINQVNSLVRTAKLPPAPGQSLNTAARWLIASLT